MIQEGKRKRMASALLPHPEQSRTHFMSLDEETWPTIDGDAGLDTSTTASESDLDAVTYA